MGVLPLVGALALLAAKFGLVGEIRLRIEHQQQELRPEHVLDQGFLAPLVELVERLAEALSRVVDDVEAEQPITEAQIKFDLAREGGGRWPFASAQRPGDLVEELLGGGAIGRSGVCLGADDVELGVPVGF